jgi:hypothetical protein
MTGTLMAAGKVAWWNLGTEHLRRDGSVSILQDIGERLVLCVRSQAKLSILYFHSLTLSKFMISLSTGNLFYNDPSSEEEAINSRRHNLAWLYSRTRDGGGSTKNTTANVSSCSRIDPYPWCPTLQSFGRRQNSSLDLRRPRLGTCGWGSERLLNGMVWSGARMDQGTPNLWVVGDDTRAIADTKVLSLSSFTTAATLFLITNTWMRWIS